MSFEAVYQDMADVAPQEYYLRAGNTTTYHTSPQYNLDPDPLIAQIRRFEPDTVGSLDTPEARIAVIDKASPHVVTEAMIGVFGLKDQLLSFSQASHKVGRQTLRLLYDYVVFAADKEISDVFDTTDNFIRIGINIDHETADRGSIQGVRLLHPHCMTVPSVPESERKVRPLDFFKPNRELMNLIDPLAVLGPQILQEHFRARTFSDIVYAHFTEADESKGAMPLAFNLQLRRGWETLLLPSTTEAMADIDSAMSEIHTGVRDAIVQASGIQIAPWQRYPLRSQHEMEQRISDLPVLSDDAKSRLLLLANALRDVDDSSMETLKNSRQAGRVSRAEQVLAYPGLAYGICMYSPGVIADLQAESIQNTPAYLAIQPFLKRASGIAGVNFDPDGTLFMIDRQSGIKVLDSTETVKRKSYQALFAAFAGLS